FLEAFDTLYKAVDERFDVRGSELSKLVMMCLSNDGVISKHRRKQFQYVASEEVFHFIEQAAQQGLEAARALLDEHHTQEPRTERDDAGSAESSGKTPLLEACAWPCRSKQPAS